MPSFFPILFYLMNKYEFKLLFHHPTVRKERKCEEMDNKIQQQTTTTTRRQMGFHINIEEPAVVY